MADDWADRRVNYVSWGDAARFTNWLHNGQPAGPQGSSTTEDGSYFLDGAMTNPELLAITREPDATWVIPSEDEWYKATYHRNNGATGDYFDYPTSNYDLPSNALIDPDPGNNATFNAHPEGGHTIGSPYYRTEVGAHEHFRKPLRHLRYGWQTSRSGTRAWSPVRIAGSSAGHTGATCPSCTQRFAPGISR